MRVASPKRTNHAKIQGEPEFPDLGDVVHPVDPITEAIVSVAKRIWPDKFAENFAAVAGISVRRAKEIKTTRTGLSADLLVRLLATSHGKEILFAVMRSLDKQPQWWVDLQTELLISADRAVENAARKRRERLERGDLS